MGNGKSRAPVFVLSLLAAACLHQPPPLALPAVTVQRHSDGTAMRYVSAGRGESPAAVERRLLSSMECPNYEIVAVGQRTEPQTDTLYWVRYRCLGNP
jgi:hypothetical protein